MKLHNSLSDKVLKMIINLRLVKYPYKWDKSYVVTLLFCIKMMA